MTMTIGGTHVLALLLGGQRAFFETALSHGPYQCVLNAVASALKILSINKGTVRIEDILCASCFLLIAC
jgi:hypothetical protein